MHLPELVTETPVRTYIPAGLQTRATALLSIKDKSADFELSRLQRRKKWAPAGDAATLAAEEARLLARRDRCMLHVEQGRMWTYSGLREYLARELLAEAGIMLPTRRTFDLPPPKPLPWRRTPKEVLGRDPMPHQVRGAEALLAAGHGSIEYATGSGKSLVLAMCLRQLGRRAAVVAYSYNVVQQLGALLEELLGKAHVGYYDGSRKILGRTVTVCTASALHHLKPGTKAWEWLTGCEVLAGDESHTYAADVLLDISTGLFAAAAYRLFASATQIRGDGLDLLLLGVIGPRVAELTFRDAVELDLLARPTFYMVSVGSSSEVRSSNPDRETRAHLYENTVLAEVVGDLVRAYVQAGWTCLLLVEEFPQLALLLQHLPEGTVALHGNTGEVSLELGVHGHDGPLTFSRSARIMTDQGPRRAEDFEGWDVRRGPNWILDEEGEVPRRYSILSCTLRRSGQYLLPLAVRDCDPRQVCAQLSSGEAPVGVLTAAGRVGVDITPPRPTALFYLPGGASEVSFVQGVGRAARRKGKSEFHVLDFRVVGVERMEAHAERRADLAQKLWRRPIEVEAREIAQILGLAGPGST